MRRRDRRSSHYLLATGLAVLGLQCGGSTGPAARGKTPCGGGTVWHPDDVARFAGCVRIDGNLELGRALDSAEGLGGIKHVAGDLTIGPSYRLINLAPLGTVVRVDGDLRVEANWLLQGVFLSNLESVGGQILVLNNSGMVALVMPRLRSFGSLQVAGNRRLERIDLSGLGEQGPIGSVEGPALDDVWAPPRIEWRKKPRTETPAKGS